MRSAERVTQDVRGLLGALFACPLLGLEQTCRFQPTSACHTGFKATSPAFTSAHLMFRKPLRKAMPLITTFQVREHHTNEEVREVVPGDFAGVLKTDRGSSYDAAELAGVKQDKCLSYALCNISDAIDRQHIRL